MALVFERSRPAGTPARRRSAARNCRASRGRLRGPRRARPELFARSARHARLWVERSGRRRAPGASGRWRRARARARVSHVGERISHSFGPATRSRGGTRRSSSTSVPALSSGKPADAREVDEPLVELGHERGRTGDHAPMPTSRIDGAAESTSPRPPMSRMISVGSPTAARHLRDDADRHGRHVRGEEVLCEQVGGSGAAMSARSSDRRAHGRSAW